MSKYFFHKHTEWVRFKFTEGTALFKSCRSKKSSYFGLVYPRFEVQAEQTIFASLLNPGLEKTFADFFATRPWFDEQSLKFAVTGSIYA